MSSARLQQQFIRLWQSCQGVDQETTLSDLAERLHCSRRHMRNLLNAMQDAGWLIWQAEAGRGKRSSLSFNYTGLALQQQRAEDLLEQDRIEQLVQLVGDKNQVRQMIAAHLGRSFRQGKHILRVLYYRPLPNLLPGSPLRRSETHLARQIFNGLTRINEEKGKSKRISPTTGNKPPRSTGVSFYDPRFASTTAANWRWKTSSPHWNVYAVSRCSHISINCTLPRPGHWIFIWRSLMTGCPGCWPASAP